MQQYRVTRRNSPPHQSILVMPKLCCDESPSSFFPTYDDILICQILLAATPGSISNGLYLQFHTAVKTANVFFVEGDGGLRHLLVSCPAAVKRVLHIQRTTPGALQGPRLTIQQK